MALVPAFLTEKERNVKFYYAQLTVHCVKLVPKKVVLLARQATISASTLRFVGLVMTSTQDVQDVPKIWDVLFVPTLR